MGEAGLLNDVGGAGGPHDFHDFILTELDHFFVVVFEGEGDFGDGEAEAIFFVGAGSEFDAVVFPGEDFAEQAEGGPVVVVHHHAAEAPSPESFGGHGLFGEGDGERADGLDGEATDEVAFRIGLVEFFGECVSGWRLVHADEVVEASEDDVAGLDHEVFAQGSGGVGEAVFVAGAGGVEKEAGGFDGVSGDDDRAGSLEVFAAIAVEVEDAVGASGGVDGHTADHGEVADFGAVFEGVGDVGDEGGGFGSDLAALDAEAAVDAVRTVAVGGGEDGDGAPGGDGDAEFGAAFDEGVADAAHGMRGVGVSVRLAPGVVGGAGDGHFLFEEFVVGFDVVVGDGPVGAEAVAGVDLEVGRVEAWGEGGPVDGASADAAAAIVFAEGDGVIAAGDAEIVPVELVGSGLVGDPVALRIPEGAGLEADDVEAGAGEALEEDAAGGTDADDREVDEVVVLKASLGDLDFLERAQGVFGGAGWTEGAEEGLIWTEETQWDPP